METEAIALLEQLEPCTLEIVLDQTRIAYRTQEAVKASLGLPNSADTQADPTGKEEEK